MKIHHDIAHKGTLLGKRTEFSFDPESTPFLQQILIDMYSDEELACVREMGTNAWDSHVAAGVSDPIEIELPSPLRPVLVVRDHGLGLTLEEIEKHLSLYGWSSKRETDDLQGMLGLGFKAPLTYTDQFSITAVKDGVKTLALVTRAENGCGAVEPIASESTDEPNGVTIEIPVKNATTMIAKATNFFRFWKEGTVLINGEPPKTYRDVRDGHKVLEIDPDITLVEGLESDFVVMGNVAYPLKMFIGSDGTSTTKLLLSDTTVASAHATFGNSKIIWAMPNAGGGGRLHVVAHVPIGAVDFTPSREALHMSERTQEVIQEIKAYVAAGMWKEVQAEIDARPTHFDALVAIDSWRHRFVSRSAPNLTYRGVKPPFSTYVPIIKREMPVEVTAPDGTKSLYHPPEKKAWAWNPGSYDNTASGMTSMQLPNFFNGVVFVHGFTGRGLREETKRKTQLWLIEEGLAEWKSNVPTGTTAGPIEPYFELKRRPENNARGGYRYPVVGMVVFVESLPPHLRTWADRPDRVRFVDYKQIKDIKLTATPRKKADSRWRIATTAGNERKVEQFTTAPGAFPVVYTLAGERPEPMLLAEVAETAQLAIVETHRKAKFLREYPDAEELGEYVKRLVKELEEDITPEAAFLMDDKGRQEFGKWDVITLPSLRRKLVDLELRTILERFAASAQDGLRADRLFQLARRLGLGGMLPDLKAKAAPARDNLQMIARRYPVLELFQYHGGSRRAELVIQALNNEYLVNS